MLDAPETSWIELSDLYEDLSHQLDLVYKSLPLLKTEWSVDNEKKIAQILSESKEYLQKIGKRAEEVLNSSGHLFAQIEREQGLARKELESKVTDAIAGFTGKIEQFGAELVSIGEDLPVIQKTLRTEGKQSADMLKKELQQETEAKIREVFNLAILSFEKQSASRTEILSKLKETRLEFATATNPATADIERRLHELDVKMAETAKTVNLPAPAAKLTTGFKGNFKHGTAYDQGHWFTFRGSSYLVLQDLAQAPIPTQRHQRGEDPLYAVIAAGGAPGVPKPAEVVSGGGGSGNVQSGTVSLSSNDTSKAITFSPSFVSPPDFVALIAAPSGGDDISFTVDYSTLTTSGVTVNFAAIPASGYKLMWFANK